VRGKKYRPDSQTPRLPNSKEQSPQANYNNYNNFCQTPFPLRQSSNNQIENKSSIVNRQIVNRIFSVKPLLAHNINELFMLIRVAPQAFVKS